VRLFCLPYVASVVQWLVCLPLYTKDTCSGTAEARDFQWR
jgi:hypothetical protein